MLKMSEISVHSYNQPYTEKSSYNNDSKRLYLSDLQNNDYQTMDVH